MNVFLFLEGVAIGSDEVALRLFDSFELPLDNGVGNILIRVPPLHTFHVKGVEHALSALGTLPFNLTHLLCFLLRLRHLLHKPGVVNVLEQHHCIPSSDFGLDVLLRLPVADGRTRDDLGLQLFGVDE